MMMHPVVKESMEIMAVRNKRVRFIGDLISSE
jgi:hypothetical protein